MDISSNYSIQLGFEEVDLILWDVPSKIKVVTNWRVSIEPSSLNKLAQIIGQETKISGRFNEYNDDCIYTPEVVVFKTDTCEPALMHPKDWWKVNIITCAAPNLRPDQDGNMRVHISNQELYNLHVKRMHRILNIAAKKENAVVILGAYGCGAFRNPPDIVASAMRQVIEEFRYHFRVIEFAVYCSPREGLNYQVFQQILGNL